MHLSALVVVSDGQTPQVLNGEQASLSKALFLGKETNATLNSMANPSRVQV